MFKLPLFGKKKLLLAFEYGVILSQVAQEQKVEITPEMVLRAESIIEKEFPVNDATTLALQMTPLLLTVFETDLDK